MNPRHRGPGVLSAALSFLVLLVALHAAGAELVVEPRRVRTNDIVTITVSLDGSFAERDGVDLPLRNLVLLGEPWISSEFAWINGKVSRRKTFRFRARAVAPGSAAAGPLVLEDQEGRRETLSAVDILVTSDPATGSNDAEQVLRTLLAERREPLFVVAEVAKSNVFVGEPVVVEWYLYNGTQVQQWQVAAVPRLAEFWTEELRRPDEVERVYVGDVLLQRVPVRRAALFPLRSGRLEVEGIAVEAAVLRSLRSGPFSVFEGDLVELMLTSAPFTIDARPIPAGEPVSAIGSLELDCGTPQQRNGGPVVIDLVLRGAGNLRAAEPPSFEGRLAGTFRLEGGDVAVATGQGFSMTRRWQLLIFPATAGRLAIPPLSMRIFDPARGERRTLRCAQRAFVATARKTEAPVAPPVPPAAGLEWRWPAIAIVAVLGVLLAVAQLLRRMAIRREALLIVRDASPGEIRARAEARTGVTARHLLHEASERGDAWRALESLLAAAERERDIADDAAREILRRVRELLRTVIAAEKRRRG